MRRAVFHALRRRPAKRNERMYVGFFLACSVGDAPHVPDRVYRNGRDSDSASDTGRHL